MKRPQLTERQAASAGPRALKEPGTPEWCWQTVDYLKDCMRHVGEQWRQAEQVMDQLKAARAWKVIPPGEPYGTFDTMLKQELGLSSEEIKKRIAEIKLAAHGGDRKSEEFQGNNITLNVPRGTAETYTLRRLHRSHKDLASRVEAGELSAHAAAIEAGFRHHTTTIRTDDAQSIAATLRRQLEPEVLRAVAALIST